MVLIPMAIYLGSLLVSVTAIILWRKRLRQVRKRTPLTRDLLRSPGESLRDTIDDMQADAFGYLMMLPGAPLLLYAMYLEQLSTGSRFGVGIMGLYLLAGIGAVAYLTLKITQKMSSLQSYRLGLDAELAVGQELNQLLRDGYRVYHDLPAEGFNIDHVVIGNGGVFAIETKGRAKPMKRDNKKEWQVDYDAKTLQFPGWCERAPLEQAQRQARWLSEWLSSAVGEPVSAQPVVALPGWYIKRTAPGGVVVFNGKNPGATLRRIGHASLSEQSQQRIAHQLDARCRNIKPRAYALDKETVSKT